MSCFLFHLPSKDGDDDAFVHVSIWSFCDVSSVGCAKKNRICFYQIVQETRNLGLSWEYLCILFQTYVLLIFANFHFQKINEM